MRRAALALALVAAACVVGCGGSPRFIVHVAARPDGSLMVERCDVSTGMLGDVYRTNCATETVPVVREPGDWKRITASED